MANVSGLPASLHSLGTTILHNYSLFTIQDVLDEARKTTGKKNVTMLDADQEQVALKCCNDVRTTYGLFEKLMSQLTPKTYTCYEYDRQLTSILKTIELKGLPLDQKILTKRYNELAVKIEILEEWAYENGFSISSNQQIGQYLAQQGFKLPVTESGKQLKVDEETLSRYKGNPVIDSVLTYRKLAKVQNTYVIPYLNKPRGYTHFRLDLATGRLASYDDNWQNIPADIRDMFNSDSGIFTWGDMSQLEMRIFAELSQDVRLLKAYQDGESIHNITFKSFYPDKPRKILIDGQEQDSPYYVKAKTGNFAMIFDAADGTIAQQCEITIPEARRFKENWFQQFPQGRNYMLQQQSTNSVHEETIFGRRMLIPMERGRHHANKCRINFPVQGSGADMNKRAIVEMWKAGFLTEDNFRIQVHDEVVMDGAYKETWPYKLLEDIHPVLKVPWDVNEGPKWH